MEAGKEVGKWTRYFPSGKIERMYSFIKKEYNLDSESNNPQDKRTGNERTEQDMTGQEQGNEAFLYRLSSSK